ncbi:MAG: lipocalin family protein [Bacteroidota bacterium]|nr:lipocalin family protein [Bacteroidota bacterium]
MISKFKTLKSLFAKSLLAALCIFAGSSAFTKCDAQALVGKWKGVSVKNYYSPDYARQTGKSMEEKTAKEAGNSEMDYLPDHSFVMSFSAPNSSDITTMKGTWSVSGNELKLTLEPQYNPRKVSTIANFSINGNTMVTTAVIAPPSRIIKTISTATRL